MRDAGEWLFRTVFCLVVLTILGLTVYFAVSVSIETDRCRSAGGMMLKTTQGYVCGRVLEVHLPEKEE